MLHGESSNRFKSGTAPPFVQEEPSALIDFDARLLMYENEIEEEFGEPLVECRKGGLRFALLWKVCGVLAVAAAVYAGNMYLLRQESFHTQKEFSVDGNLKATVMPTSRQQPLPEEFNATDRDRLGLALIAKTILGDPRAIALAAPEKEGK